MARHTNIRERAEAAIGGGLLGRERELALLGEGEREPREVRLLDVHLLLGEVGVHRQRRQRVGAQALRRVETRAILAAPSRTRRRDAAAARERWSHGKPQPEIEGRHAGE